MESWVQILISILSGSFGTMVIKSIIDHWLNKRKNEEQIKASSIDNYMKSDTYWENRFRGLKLDYEDREKHHNARYEELKNAYEEKLKFNEPLVARLKNEISELSEELSAKAEFINSLEQKSAEKDTKILDLTNKIVELSGKIHEQSPQQMQLDNNIQQMGNQTVSHNAKQQ